MIENAKTVVAKIDSVLELIGNTPLLRVGSLSKLTGSNIYLKCENRNPGGSVKDRAALQMIRDAEASGALRPGMTIVEGTAGNTGIGLSMVAKALGYKVIIAMPKGQDPEKEKLLRYYGATVHLVDVVPFTNPDHFFHTAKKIAQGDPKHWWANQFDNLSNSKAHYTGTGPEIYAQLDGKVDAVVSAAGTGGTIAGVSRFFKERSPSTKIVLVDPQGSGLCSFFHQGNFVAQGSTIAEGIGIMRLVENFRTARIDEAFTVPDQSLVNVAYHIRDHDGIYLGMSAALNLAGAVRAALKYGPGKNIVSFLCDGGERAINKLYSQSFLKEQSLESRELVLQDL
jgi:cysteine synthase A